MPKNKSIKNMTDEELRKFYGLDNDLTEEEKERLQKQAALLSIDITLKLVKNMTEETLQAFEQIRGELQTAFTPETVRKLSDLLEEVRNREEAGTDPDEQPLPEVLNTKGIPLFLPLDRSQELFSLDTVELTNPEGYGLKYRKESKKNGIKQAGYIFAADFDELAKHVPELGKLGEYARGVYNAISSHYFADPEKIYTLQSIYEYNGGTGNCPETERQKILRTLEKMTFRIKIDSTDFIDEYGTGKKNKSRQPSKALRVYRRLIDYELVEALENGKVINSGIRIIQEPPLLTLAKLWEQYSTVPREVLQIEQKDGERRQKSETFRAVRMYLATYAAKLKNNKNRKTPLSNKVSFNAIYEACGIDPDDRRQRKKKSAAKRIIIESLEHFKNIGFIEGYNAEAKNHDGQPAIIIFVEKKDPKKAKKAKKDPSL